MNIKNDIPVVYCSEYLKSCLKEKGCKLLINGTNTPKSAYELSVAVDWLYVNFGWHIWATYDGKLKQWVGNYHKDGDLETWVSGFTKKEEAIEAAMEIVLDYFI